MSISIAIPTQSSNRPGTRCFRSGGSSDFRRSKGDLDDQTIRYYQEATDAFFEEKALIRSDRFHEMRFDDLERDPIGQMRDVYESLRLPDFRRVEPAIRQYVASLSGYEKNTYAPLSPELRARIARDLRKSFEAWGYAY